MVKFGGIDGCRGGWFIIFFDSDRGWSCALYPNLESLWQEMKSASLLLIDIPIGLPEAAANGRECDHLARKILGGRSGSSLFPVPCREVLRCKNYTEANRVSRQLANKGLSVQSWNIGPKIVQADTLLRKSKSARSVFRESHPELCFAKLSGKPLTYKKNTPSGIEERLAILKSHDPSVLVAVNEALERYRRKVVRKDDILDAAVLALSAGEKGRVLSIPEKVPKDRYGLRMEITYREK
ncbi:DUF429 domain-containing protein [Chitinispirillales bacterium ANBcel5]|uniref:DUF429 domain-containing protein n=1 Tax=Cellulosispirillum alkaliphilum TaxID=3039283 RepID=UPI002A4F8BF8|nr:DUF429 domain-containing protein [Chitinispirillales bacterium ANBcel5]